MENDPAHAKRLEDNLTRRAEFANPELEAEQMRRNVHFKTRLGRHKNLQTQEELRAAWLELVWICD